jgi:hypothetical protein
LLTADNGLTVNNALLIANAGISSTTGTFSGLLTATTFQLTTSPTAGYVLTSDANGNGT